MNEKHPPLVVVVVLNWNGFHDTVRCINSLQTTDYPRMEVIIVDNASDDGSPERLSELYPGLTVLRQSTNGGYGRGNNAGIRMALERGAEYILIVNNDITVRKQFLWPLVREAERNQNAGILTCLVCYADAEREVYYAAGEFSRILCAGVNKGRRSRHRRRCKVSFANGSFLLVRRMVFETVGMFDEKYFMYFEDLEYSRRVSRGFDILYIPQVVVYHKSGAGRTWSSYTDLYLYYHTRNRLWVFRDESILYRLYVVGFSLTNVLGKSIAILTSKIEGAGKRKKLRSLWSGFRDGLFQREPT